MPLTLGFLALFLLVGGVGYWSVRVEIAGAVISSGMIRVESNRQVVQHPTGGVVGKINVKEGDVIEAGDVLVRLDDVNLRSELSILESQLFEIMARKGRLVAERDGADRPVFEPAFEPLDLPESEQKKLIDGQLRLFQARRDSLEKEAEQLAERTVQIGSQVSGTEAQLEAYKIQVGLVRQELKDQQALLEKGLTRAAQITTLQRKEASLLGDIGNLQASIAQFAGMITEIEVQILKLQVTRREEAITTLRDLQFREIELVERRLSTLATMSRLDIKAPVSGVVYGNQVFALQSVIQPADPIMYIIPQNSSLVINARIEAIHIDQISVGQEAALRFSAFDQRTTPEVIGHVTKVSPDVFQDENTGVGYYQVELLPDDGEIAKLGDIRLLPGMPVEAYIRTEARTPLQYLVKPLTDYFNKAFRES